MLEGLKQNKCKKRLEIVQGIWGFVGGFGDFDQRGARGWGCGGGKLEVISWIVYRMFIRYCYVSRHVCYSLTELNDAVSYRYVI